MAKGKKTGGRNFKPGQVANPKGGGALSPETRAIRKITQEHIQDVADVILDGNIGKLGDLARDPESSVLKVWLAKAAAEGIKKGDIHPLEVILNRTMGKPKENVSLEVAKKGRTPEEILADLAELEAARKEQGGFSGSEGA